MSNIKEEDKENVSKVKRWRLILGEAVEKDFEEMSGGMDIALNKDELLMDQALAAIYNEGSESYLGSRGAGRGKSSPHISRWLGDVRNLFDKDLVRIIQADAMERCGLKQLMFEPEILENLEPDVNLASTILLLKDQVPKQSKEGVRNFIKKIVEEINKLLESDLKRAVNASINKRQHSPIPSAAALDFNTTIKRGIKNYNPSLKRIVPEHYYFFDKQAKTAASKYTIILDIDQSGSMGESVIYSSIMSCTKNVYEYYGVGSETEHETDNGKTDEKKDKKETTEEIQTIEAFIKNDFGETPIWVEGYIVGSCTKSIKNAVWEYPFSSDNAILLADEPGETDTEKVIAIQLKAKELKLNVGLVTNPDNYNTCIRFLGIKQKYLGIWGMKDNIQAYEWVK